MDYRFNGKKPLLRGKPLLKGKPVAFPSALPNSCSDRCRWRRSPRWNQPWVLAHEQNWGLRSCSDSEALCILAIIPEIRNTFCGRMQKFMKSRKLCTDINTTGQPLGTFSNRKSSIYKYQLGWRIHSSWALSSVPFLKKKCGNYVTFILQYHIDLKNNFSFSDIVCFPLSFTHMPFNPLKTS